MTPREIPRGLLVLIGVLAAQQTIGLDLHIDGAHPNLILGLSVVIGLVGGTQRGAIIGFFAGIALDLFLPTPFGLTALVGTVLGTAAGQLVAAGVDRTAWFFLPGVAALGSAIGVIMFAVLGTVLGQPDMLTVGLGPVVGVVAIVNGLVAPLFARAARWALGEERRSSAWRGTLVSGDAP